MNKSYIIYDGPSLIDNKPIVVIAQVGSKNPKTGSSMIQTYILRSDIDPVSASRTGEDKSICGNCIHRGKVSAKDSGQAIDRTCYVTLAHGPLAKYKGLKAGLYGKLQDTKSLVNLGKDKLVRIGTYGDPVAVPQHIWDNLTKKCKSWTAYTHGKKNVAPHMYMTSADSHSQAKQAWKRGERTFRVIPDIESLDMVKEFLCPASAEMGKRTTCEKCKLCNGTKTKAKSVAIVAHGNSAHKLTKMFNKARKNAQTKILTEEDRFEKAMELVK